MKKIGFFVLLIVSSVPAYADSDFTIFGAAQRQGKLTVDTATATAGTPKNFDPASFGTFGIRFGGGGVLGHEQTFAYTPNFLDSNGKAIIYNGDLILQAPLPKFKPYVTGGLGGIYSWGTDDAGRPSFGKLGHKFAVNYGGGVKVLPAGPVGIRFDIRGYLIPDVKFNLPVPTISDPIATVKSRGQTVNMLEVGIGIVFGFGR